jgi:hypothetical protein
LTDRPAGARPDPAPMKPIVTDPAGAIVALQDAWLAVTRSPDCVTTAFHIEVIRWRPGNVQVSVHGPSGAVPALVSTTCAWKPPGQELTTE